MIESGLIASVVVPVYNKEEYLRICIESLASQTIDLNKVEALFIDDGSQDASLEILKASAKEYPWLHVITQENSGVCTARNSGIRASRGRYIFFLDPDDTLSRNAIEDVTCFFEEHFDEVDLVTYKIAPIRNGRRGSLHYRYKYLNKTGIYDLDEGENCYICQTTMNVCVKNEYGANSTFDFESLNGIVYHEDQEYITKILLRKLRIGYVSTATYNWIVNDTSTTSTIVNPLYIFENTVLMYEKLFACYPDKPPKYLQALLLHDLNWKMKSDVLLPYHYSGSAWGKAIERLEALISRIEVPVLANHPTLGPYRMAYLLQHSNHETSCVSGINGLALVSDSSIAYFRKGVEIVVLRTDFEGSFLRIVGFVKSPCFQFGGMPELFAESRVENGEITVNKLDLHLSSWSRNQSKMLINEFWGFEHYVDLRRDSYTEFYIRYAGARIPCSFFFMGKSVFSGSSPKRMQFIHDGLKLSIRGRRLVVKGLSEEERRASYLRTLEPSTKSRIKLVRKLIRKQKGRNGETWLYYDCHGVEKGNGYYQFLHDWEKKDGAHRYYVVNDDLETKRHLFSPAQFRHVIAFGSKRHKMLFLASDKIITAYIEEKNWMPFSKSAMKNYRDLFCPEVIYLQHGVLHATMPWKFSADRLLIDKIVVSTHYEIDNLINNYGYSKDQLICSGAPRYAHFDLSKQPQRKILFAPSWRSYLVTGGQNGSWRAKAGALEKSSFFTELMSFINSPNLESVLEEHNYTLELKLHPIMLEAYGEAFELHQDRVKFAAESVDEADYAIFITDFSSYRFDFVYLQRAIMYFLPDQDEFRAGLCAFRSTDLPLEGQFGDMARTHNEAIEILETLLCNDAIPKTEYANQMDSFFTHYDCEQCERIYGEITESSRAV